MNLIYFAISLLILKISFKVCMYSLIQPSLQMGYFILSISLPLSLSLYLP